MKRAIVTGGSGFIGYHLAAYLSEKDEMEVTVIDNFARGSSDEMFRSLIEKENVIFIEGDMTEKTFYKQLSGRYDYVYHLAAINGTKNFYDRPYDVLRANILTLMNMLEWCTKENCGCFLYTSSSETYAGTMNCYLDNHSEYIPTREDIPLTIDNVLNPRWSYGGSKLIGEILTSNYGRVKELPVKIIRYHNIYGPRMGFDHVLPEFIKRIYDDENPFVIYGGDETRAFCDVRDGVRATEAVMLSEQCRGEIVHIGKSDEEIKIIDLLKKLLGIANKNPQIQIQGAPEGCVSRRCPCTDKLYQLTGYRADITLEEGLPKIYEWYMEKYKEMEGKQ